MILTGHTRFQCDRKIKKRIQLYLEKVAKNDKMSALMLILKVQNIFHQTICETLKYVHILKHFSQPGQYYNSSFIKK
jgi:hypothetical protein